MLLKIRQYFDSCLHKLSYLLKVEVFCNHLFDIWKSHFKELVKVHSLKVLTVHPTKLNHVKYSRRLIYSGVIKLSDKTFQVKYLSSALSTPAKKCYEVYNCLRYKALLDKVFVGAVSAAL